MVLGHREVTPHPFRIVYRKLNVPRTEDFLLKFEEFIVDNIDKKFEVSLGKLLTFKSKAFNK